MKLACCAAYLGLAEAESLEAELVDELGRGQLARGVLEVAAARGVVEGVLAAPQLGVTGDLVEQRVAAAGLQREGRLEDDGWRIALEAARAVAEREVGGLGEVLLAAGQHAGAHEGVAHRAPVGAGVADDGAAYRARDVAGELEAGQTATARGRGRPRAEGRRRRPSGPHRRGACRSLRASTTRPRMPRSLTRTLVAWPSTVTGRPSSRPTDDGVPQVLGAPRREQILGRPPDPIGAVRPDRHGALQTGQLALQDLAGARLETVVHHPFPTIASSARL